MATQGNIMPKADQPRVTTEQMNRANSGPNLQYRVNSVKSYSNRTANRSSNSNRLTRG